MAWASAPLWFQHAPCMQAISSAALPTITSFQVREWSGLAWAVAVRSIVVTPLLTAIAAAARRRSSELEEHFCANSAWACAGFEFLHPPCSNAIAAASLRRLSEFMAPTLGNMARSLWVMMYDARLWELLNPGRTRQRPAEPPRTVYEVPGVTDRRFEGTLAKVAQDYGFVSCPELYRRYRRDTFVAADALGAFNVGDAVSFGVIFKKAGAPQAVSLAEPGASAPSAPAAPTELACAWPRDRAPQPLPPPSELEHRGYVLRTVGQPLHGARPERGDRVCISYVARLASDGRAFDAAEGLYFTLGVGAVIAGWDLAVAEMSVGQEVLLVVHRSHAYGDLGAPAAVPVPPHADLVFELKLLAVARGLAGEPCPTTLVLGAVAAEGPFVPSGKGTKVAEGLVHGWKVAPCSRGEKLAALLRTSTGLSVQAWLAAIDPHGALLRYKDTLAREYDTAEQIVCVYAKRSPDGSVRLEPDFFADMGVKQLAHRRLFQRWFEG